MKNIHWIFFDMGGVILNDDEPERRRQATLLQVIKKYIPSFTMEDIHKAWMQASKLPGSLRIQALKIILKDSSFLPKAEVEMEFLRQDGFNSYHNLSFIQPEAKGVLSKLSQHYKLGITANQNIKTMNLLEQANLLPYFSHQKLSDHMGLAKPDLRFFQKVLEDSGAKAEESIIIDDNWYRCLVPAKQLGMTTILFKRKIVPYPETANPDFTINKLEDLPNLLID